VHIETLKTFRDLVATGSFGKAAALNYVSQSAVSQQLKALETRYGCVLVERGAHRPVALTDAGRIFYTECCELLERFQQLERRVRDGAATLAGAIRVATVYSVGLHALPPYVTRFLKTHPQVQVHVEYSRTNRICEALAHDLLDFGIVALPVPRAMVSVIPWHDERLVLVCPPGHRLAGTRPVRLARLQDEPFIAFARDIPTRKTVDRVLHSHGVTVRTLMEFDNIETIKRSIEVGSGISILPETTVTTEVKSGLLARRDLAGGPFLRQLGIVHRRGRVLTAAAQEFIRLLTRVP
jgi:DNA-binding transcriptional LysR family regulator